jgi:uncharacterized protein YecE (DUF72 family)
MTSRKSQERVRIGCQGWNYDDWVTKAADTQIFYPHGTRAERMLEIYARAFSTVEVDSTFYAIPSISTVEGWRQRTPPDFTFALKLPQEITHVRALRGADAFAHLEEFCARARLLREKLASVLIQLPPQFSLTSENARALAEFLQQLPRDLRFSLEFRATDWLHRNTLKILAEHNVALALVEGEWIARGALWNFIDKPTADFAYVRFMGARNLARFDTVQRPQDVNLKLWSDALERLSRHVSHIDIYFSNFYEGHASASANKLKRLFGQTVVTANDLEDQLSLF